LARALTVRTIETLKPVKERREIPDAYLPGLYLIVQPSGAKAWAVRYRHGRRPRKHTLGGYPAIDLKSARELGAKALRIAEGKRKRKGARRELTASRASQRSSLSVTVTVPIVQERRKRRSVCFNRMSCHAGAGKWRTISPAAMCSTCLTAS
jgi:hypothetical protein